MEFALHRNAILTGVTDCYCLACESHLWSEQDAYRHIEKPIHEKNLALCPYKEPYSSDRIRNVKKGYFCEFCNALLLTAVAVSLHVTSIGHTQKKLHKISITRLGNDVLIDNKILIAEAAWNGIIDGVCAVCNIEMEEEEDVPIHTTNRMHVLNLIQKKLEFSYGGVVYRKVDEISFHCLVCNLILAIKSIETHAENKKHVENMRYHESQEKVYNLRLKMINQTREAKRLRDNILDNAAQVKEVTDSDTIQELNETETLSNETKPEELEEHRNQTPGKEPDQPGNAIGSSNTQNQVGDSFDDKKHSKNAKKVESEETVETNAEKDIQSKVTQKQEPLALESTNRAETSRASNSIENSKLQDSRNDPSEFARENDITYNSDDNNAFCRLCKVKMPSTLSSMKEHVLGSKHRKKMTVIASRVNVPIKATYSTIPIEDFINVISHISTPYVHDDVVINYKYCLKDKNFSMLSKIEDGIRCLCCQVNIENNFELSVHLAGTRHKQTIESMPVVRGLDGEFVREVRPELFHCGYCGLLLNKFEELMRHLSSDQHRVQKTFARIRLNDYLPRLYSQRSDAETCNLM